MVTCPKLAILTFVVAVDAVQKWRQHTTELGAFDMVLRTLQTNLQMARFRRIVDMHFAAKDVQRVWRGYCGRRCWALKFVKDRAVAAILRVARGFLGRCKARRLRNVTVPVDYAPLYNRAATTLQGFAKVIQAKTKLLELRDWQAAAAAAEAEQAAYILELQREQRRQELRAEALEQKRLLDEQDLQVALQRAAETKFRVEQLAVEREDRRVSVAAGGAGGRCCRCETSWYERDLPCCVSLYTIAGTESGTRRQGSSVYGPD